MLNYDDVVLGCKLVAHPVLYITSTTVVFRRSDLHVEQCFVSEPRVSECCDTCSFSEHSIYL